MLKLIDKLESGYGVNPAYIILPVGGIIAFFVFSQIELPYAKILRYMVASAPIWLPIITFKLFYEYWMYYVRKDFNLKQGRVTLEIKLPQEVYKSPEAMELVLTQLYQTASPDNHVQTYWDGKHPPMYGLEIVSRGGDVRFYINTPIKKFKNMFEMHLYAQYPGIEIRPLPIDYTAEIPWDPERYQMFSFHSNLQKPDAYPIKTYVDFGLHTMPKEEEKIDPITSVLDVLGSIGPGEHYWIQILIDINRSVNFKKGSLTKQGDWIEPAQKEIENIIANARKRRGYGPDDKTNLNEVLSETEKDTIKAIERSLGKRAFNGRIRCMYIAESDKFLPGERIGPLISCWMVYGDLNRNQIGFVWRTDFDWNWWQDPFNTKKTAMKKQELHDYKTRSYSNMFMAADTAKVYTTEELATIFHLPGKVALTPGLGRIPSTRSEAPSNLPTGNG